MITFQHYVRVYDVAQGTFRALSARDILCMGAGAMRRLNVNGRYVTLSPTSVTMGRGGRTVITGTVENGASLTFYARIQDAPNHRFAFVAGTVRSRDDRCPRIRFIGAHQP